MKKGVMWTDEGAAFQASGAANAKTLRGACLVVFLSCKGAIVTETVSKEVSDREQSQRGSSNPVL